MSKKQVSRPDFPRTPDSQWLTNQAKTDRCHRWSNVMFPFLKEPVYLRQSFIFRPQKFRGKISGEASPPGLPSSRRSKDIWCETRAKAAPESQLPGSWTSPRPSREWKNGSNSSHNCTPFLHSLPTKGKTIIQAAPT